MQAQAIEIAVCVDGPELLASDQAALAAMGWRVSGQYVRPDGMPIVYLSNDYADTAAAIAMRKRLAAAYGVAA